VRAHVREQAPIEGECVDLCFNLRMLLCRTVSGVLGVASGACVLRLARRGLGAL
jgi:hypothetical protein